MTITKPKVYRRINIWFVTAIQSQDAGKHIDLCFAAYDPRQAWRDYMRYVTFHADQH